MEKERIYGPVCGVCGEPVQYGVTALVAKEDGFFVIIGTIDPLEYDYWQEKMEQVKLMLHEAGIKVSESVICSDH